MSLHVTIPIERLAEIVCEAGNPTEGALAATLWDALSGKGGPLRLNTNWSATFVSAHDKVEAYRILGYQPMSGYPLKRLEGKT